MFAAENGLKGDPRLQGISQAIRVVPHFPKPGLSLFVLHLCFWGSKQNHVSVLILNWDLLILGAEYFGLF